MRLLVAEDEKRLNKIICEALEDEGYSVDACFDGEQALEYARAAEYDAMIMDIMMPRLDGLEAVRQMRREHICAPVLFLTARDSIADRVEGLESGGDYYLVKPFHFPELLAVVRAITRKYTGNRSNIFTAADLTMDISAKTVTRAGKNIDLTAREFALLECMLRNKGIVLTREMIENNLWNFDYEGGTNVVDVYIGYLRKKMDTGVVTKLIRTVWGSGWTLREE